MSISGIQDIRIGQYQELISEGFVTSYNFKTVGKFFQQPITVSNVIISVLSTYVNDIRPAIRSKNKTAAHDMDRLFLTFDGLHNDQLGRLITQYFAPWSLHITSTNIRSLVETEANILKKRGDISSTDFSSLQNIGGHSEKTSEEYYIKERTCDDIEAGKRIFDKLHLNRNSYLESGKPIDMTGDSNEETVDDYGGSLEPQSSNNPKATSSYVTPPRKNWEYSSSSKLSAQSYRPASASNSGVIGNNEPQSNQGSSQRQPSVPMTTSDSSPSIAISQPSVILWGLNHPQFNIPPGARAGWSDAELYYLGNLVSTFKEERYQ